MSQDKVVYSKELGSKSINLVHSLVTGMLHIVVGSKIGSGTFIGRNVGKPFKMEQQDTAIKFIDNLHIKWKSLDTAKHKKFAKQDYKANLSKLAYFATKNLCTN